MPHRKCRQLSWFSLFIGFIHLCINRIYYAILCDNKFLAATFWLRVTDLNNVKRIQNDTDRNDDLNLQ